jgi:hypothetical protein
MVCVHRREEPVAVAPGEPPADRMADLLDVPAAPGELLVCEERVETRKRRDDPILGAPGLVRVEEGGDRRLVAGCNGPPVAHRGTDVGISVAGFADEEGEDHVSPR